MLLTRIMIQLSFDSAESTLVTEIVKKLVEMVFLDTVAKW